MVVSVRACRVHVPGHVCMWYDVMCSWSCLLLFCMSCCFVSFIFFFLFFFLHLLFSHTLLFSLHTARRRKRQSSERGEKERDTKYPQRKRRERVSLEKDERSFLGVVPAFPADPWDGPFSGVASLVWTWSARFDVFTAGERVALPLHPCVPLCRAVIFHVK